MKDDRTIGPRNSAAIDPDSGDASAPSSASARPGGEDASGDRAPDRVARALAQLPAAGASAGFTDKVLARVAARAPAPVAQRRRRRVALPALLGAAAAAAGALLWRLPPGDLPPEPHRIVEVDPAEPSDLRLVGAELDRLRREQRDLATAIDGLRAERGRLGVPVIYVGQSAGVELILDLSRFQQRSRLQEEGENR